MTPALTMLALSRRVCCPLIAATHKAATSVPLSAVLCRVQVQVAHVPRVQLQALVMRPDRLLVRDRPNHAWRRCAGYACFAYTNEILPPLALPIHLLMCV